MLINHTNHEVSNWETHQLEIAIKLFTAVEDYTFPIINPEWEFAQVKDLAIKNSNDIIERYNKYFIQKQLTIHLQGEFSYFFAIVPLFLEKRIPCVISTRTKDPLEKMGLVKPFVFVKFRELKL